MASARTLVYLVRHGQTALNESGVLRGQLDPPLDDTGRRHAALLGEALGQRQPSLVAASPLRRARETAQPVADHAGLAVTVDRCLLDRIDEIVPPGTDVGALDMAYRPPALQHPDLRRRPTGERAAA